MPTLDVKARRRPRVAAWGTGLMVLLVGSVGATLLRSGARAASAVDVRERVLGNGLRVLVVTDTRVPRIGASLWYRVGAIQEPVGEHGSTHFLEHAIHQGTTTVGTRDFEAEKPLLREIDETELALTAA